MVASLNVPVPLLVQSKLVALLAVAVLREYVPLSQMVASTPAFTVACGLMVSTIWSTSPTHGTAEVTVMVRMTDPFRISALLGV